MCMGWGGGGSQDKRKRPLLKDKRGQVWGTFKANSMSHFCCLGERKKKKQKVVKRKSRKEKNDESHTHTHTSPLTP